VLIDNANSDDEARLAANLQALCKLAKLDEVTIRAGADPLPPSLSTLCRQMEIHVPMDGVIDIVAEKTRLSKERDRAAAEVDRLRQKLTNAKFTERAPADVVAAERAKLEAAEDTLNKTDGQIERLGGLP